MDEYSYRKEPDCEERTILNIKKEQNQAQENLFGICYYTCWTEPYVKREPNYKETKYNDRTEPNARNRTNA